MQIDATRILIRRRLSTIFAADVAGYSRLMGADEERTLERLDAARGVMDAMIVRHGGRIANTAGDSVIAEFPNAVAAVRCALEVQEELRAQRAALPAAEQLQFRIGINLGSIMANGRDVLGDNVNIAARIENIAQPGGVCISGAVYDQIKDQLGVVFRPIGEQSLKNISRKVMIYEAVAPAAGALPIPPPRRHRRLPVVPLAVGGLLIAATAAFLATGVVRIERPPTDAGGPATAETPAPVPPTAAAGPSSNASGNAGSATPTQPAATSAAPPAVAVPPPPADIARLSNEAIKALQGFDCARLNVKMSGGADMDLWGYVASEGDGQQAAARLAAIAGVGRVTNHATVMAPPLCRALDVLFEETAYADPGQAGPVIDRGGEKGVYQEGETLNVSVTPMLDGYLYVDYIDGQGHYVMHLLPNDFRPDNRVQANRALAFGTSAKEREAYAVGPPFGTNLVIAVLAPQPLFGTQRQFREPAEAYLTDLRQRLHALGAEGQRNRLLASKGVLAFVPR